MNDRVLRPGMTIFLILLLSSACSGEDEESGDAGIDAEYDADVEREDAERDVDDGPVPPLVSPSLWTMVAAEDDPLSDHRPAEVECPDEATKTELLSGDLSYAVDTTDCNYLAVSQSSLVAVTSGDTLQARIWHFALTTTSDGEPSGTAHLAVLFDDEILWEDHIVIPADGTLLTPEWEVTQDYPRGTEVIFHLHNHGDNQWNFIDLEIVDH